MKILVTTAGPVPAKKKAEYIVNIARGLGADIIALHILQEEQNKEKGEQALDIFAQAGQEAHVNVARVLEKGDIVPAIVKSAEKEGADLIIMGASEGRVVAEWVSAGVMEKTNVPVVVIPHEFRKSQAADLGTSK
jgi:nucleotide-binding universal stress UspA family protein